MWKAVVIAVLSVACHINALDYRLCQETPKEKHCLIEYSVRYRWPHQTRRQQVNLPESIKVYQSNTFHKCDKSENLLKKFDRLRYVYNWHTRTCFEIRWSAHCHEVPSPAVTNNFTTEKECLNECGGWA